MRFQLAILSLLISGPALAADWYLHGNANSWNTLANWWSAPVGGTNPAALSGTDTYHLNGYQITTPELTTNTTFAGGALVVNGKTGVAGGDQASGSMIIKFKSAAASITIPKLVCKGGPTRFISNTATTLKSFDIGQLELPGDEITTFVNNIAATFKMNVGTLSGGGDLNLRGSGNSVLGIASASGFHGTLYLTNNATLEFTGDVVSSGALVVEEGSRITLNSNVTVTSLVVGGSTTSNEGLVGLINHGTPLASNTTYSAADLAAAFPLVFTGGTGNITVTQPLLSADASAVVNRVRIGQAQANSGGGIWNRQTPDFGSYMRKARMGMARIGGFPKDGDADESLAAMDMTVIRSLNAGAQPQFIQYLGTQARTPVFMNALLNLAGVSGPGSGATPATNIAFLVKRYMAPPYNLTTQYWEVGNEPDISVDFQVSNAQEYVNFYQSIHDQLVASGVRGNVKLCGPVVAFEFGFAANGNRTDTIMNTFLTACAGQRGGFNQVDIVTRHVYPYIYDWETSPAMEDSAYNLLNVPSEMVTFTPGQVAQKPYRGEGALLAKMSAAGMPDTVGTGITEMNVTGAYQRTITQGLWFLMYDHYSLYNPRNELGMGFTFERADSGWGYFTSNGTPTFPYWASYIHGALGGTEVLKQASSDPHLLFTATKDPYFIYLQVINRGLSDITATVDLKNAPVAGPPTLFEMSATVTPETGTPTTLGTTFSHTFPTMSARIFRFPRSDAPPPVTPELPPVGSVLDTSFYIAPEGMQIYTSNSAFTPTVTGDTLRITNTVGNTAGAVVFNGQPLPTAADRAQVRFGYRIDSGHAGSGFVFGAYSSSPLGVGADAGGLGFHGQPNRLWGVKIQDKGSLPDRIEIVPDVTDSLVTGWATRALEPYPANYAKDMFVVIDYEGSVGTVRARLYRGTNDTTGVLLADITNRLSNPPVLPAGSVFGFTGSTTSFAEITAIQNLTITANHTGVATPSKPGITSGTSSTGTVGIPFTYQITASNNPTAFDAAGLPVWLTVNTATGLISGTPTETGVFNVTLSATNEGGTGTAQLALTILPEGLPAPWNNADVGDVGYTGSTTHSGGTFAVRGEGKELMSPSTTDALQYVYQATNGDFSITARVATVQNIYSKCEGGVMIRKDLTPGSMFMAVGVTAGASLQFTYRSAAGATSVDVWGPGGKTAPYWVRLVRVGDSFSAFTSPDNVVWSQIGSTQTIAMGAAPQAGMFSTNNSGQLCTSTFDNVAVIPGRTPFDVWIEEQFTAAELLDPTISGEMATPAGDGISNLMKYALHLDPKVDGTGGLPIGGRMATAGNEYPTLSYTQVISATDLLYALLVSSDMVTWHSDASHLALVSVTDNPDGVTQTVVVRSLDPISTSGRQFIRLKVTKP